MKEKLLWGLPELASEHGEMVDHMLLTVTYFMAILFVFWSGYLVVAIWKFRRKRNPVARYQGMTSHWASHLEIGVIITECILLLGFAFPLWAARVDDHRYPTGGDVVRARAIGEKFLWRFHYPGKDGVFGRIDPFLISQTNPIGLDSEDPNAKDDFVTVNEFRIPVGQPIAVGVTAKDVIHSFHLLPMRIQQDAMPGSEAHIWFKPTKTSPEDGWDILCGQLCGPGHANMAAKLYVDTPEDFQAWLDSQAPATDEEQPVAAADEGGESKSSS